MLAASELYRPTWPRPWFDLTARGFGARNDGSNPTKTGDAFRRAFDKIVAGRRGGRIYVPRGLYVLDALAECEYVAADADGHGIELFGDGHATIIRPRAGYSDPTLLKFTGNGSRSLWLHDLQLQTWTGGGGATVDVTPLWIEGPADGSQVLERLRLWGLTATAPMLKIGAVEHLRVRDSMIQGWYNPATLPAGIGVQTLGPNDPTQLLFDNVKIIGFNKGFTNAAAHLNTSRLSFVNNCAFDDCLYGLYLSGIAVNALDLLGARFEVTGLSLATSPVIQPLYLNGSGILGVVVDGCYFTGLDGANTTAMRFEAIKGWRVTNCVGKTRNTPADNTCHFMELAGGIGDGYLSGNRNHTAALAHLDIPGSSGIFLLDDWTATQRSLDVVGTEPRTIYDHRVPAGGEEALDVNLVNLQHFRHLQLRLYPRSMQAGVSNTSLNLRFSADGAAYDSGANYDYQQTWGNAAAASGTEGLGQTLISLGTMPAADAPANTFGACTVDILDYAQASNNKVVQARTGNKLNTIAGSLLDFSVSGWWRNNSAIKGIRLSTTGGERFAEGTRLTVVGY